MMRCILTFALGLMVSQQVPAPAIASQTKSHLGSPLGENNYVAKLRSKFRGSIIYKSNKASEIIRNFNLDCKQSDGRYIPFENILLVGISQLQSNTSHMLDFVQEAGGEVRVTQTLMDSKGRPITRSDVAFEINEWGELISVNVPAGAISAACAGSFGPIWQLPASDTGDDQMPVETETGHESDSSSQPGETSQLGATRPSSTPAKEWTHAKQCEFFRLAAASMINFRDQSQPQSYGLQMVAIQLASYQTIAGRGLNVSSGLEAEARLGIAANISRMAHDIWTSRNTVGELIPPPLIIAYATHSCSWPAFDW